MDQKIASGLISGKIKPEIGNKDHIEFLQSAEKNIAEFRNGISFDYPLLAVDVSILVDFKCPKCLSTIEFQLSPAIKVAAGTIISETKILQDWETCGKCKTEFELKDGKIKMEE